MLAREEDKDCSSDTRHLVSLGYEDGALFTSLTQTVSEQDRKQSSSGSSESRIDTALLSSTRQLFRMDVLTSVDPTASQTSSSDALHPSFFELAAQSQLSELIKPAVRYVVAVLAQRNPRYLLRIVNWFDEVYALLMTAVESHYLRVWGSSFSENFYGLRRRKRPGLSRSSVTRATSLSIAKTESLGKREIRLSLLFLVGLPYLRAKLDDIWERNGGGLTNTANLFGDDRTSAPSFQDSSQPLMKRLETTLMQVFKTAYPYFKTLYQFWLLTYNVRYLFDKTPYWRPWLSLMRVDVRRVGPNDGPRRKMLPKNMPSLVRQPTKFLAVVLKLVPGMLFEALKYGLPASIFLFKFLEWWYGADNPRRRRGNSNSTSAGATQASSTTTLDAPATLLPDLKRGVLGHVPQTIRDTLPQYKLPQIFALSSSLIDRVCQDPTDAPTHPKLLSASANERKLIHNSCPLCGAMPINNPAVLPSGYVFCYTCAFNYVEQHATCPVSSISVPERKDALRKVLG